MVKMETLFQNGGGGVNDHKMSRKTFVIPQVAINNNGGHFGYLL